MRPTKKTENLYKYICTVKDAYNEVPVTGNLTLL